MVQPCAVGDSGLVVAVCAVAQLHSDKGAVTAIDKRPVEGPVDVNEFGLVNDVQASRKNHGGIDKAVYLLHSAEADYWQERLDLDLPPGQLGENLRIEDLAIDDLPLGTRLAVGDNVVLEISDVRTPCSKFSRYLRQPSSFIKQFADRGRPGVYTRVIRRGSITSGDTIEVISLPEHGVSAQRWFTRRDRDDAQALLDDDGNGWNLADNVRAKANAAVRSA